MADFKRFLLVGDLLLLVFGILLLFAPGVLSTLSEWMNKVVLSPDRKVYSARKILGVLCLALAVYLTYVIFKY